jgi:hypothetical protein
MYSSLIVSIFWLKHPFSNYFPLNYLQFSNEVSLGFGINLGLGDVSVLHAPVIDFSGATWTEAGLEVRLPEDVVGIDLLVNKQFVIENGHRNS